MEFEGVLQKHFDSLDRDRNGHLDKREIEECLKKAGLRPEKATDFLRHFDKNKDGKVSRDEFLKASRRKISPKDYACANLRNMFNTMDKDKSGTLSSKELQKALNSNTSVVVSSAMEQWVLDHDTDGDKELSYEEFISFAEQML